MPGVTENKRFLEMSVVSAVREKPDSFKLGNDGAVN